MSLMFSPCCKRCNKYFFSFHCIDFILCQQWKTFCWTLLSCLFVVVFLRCKQCFSDFVQIQCILGKSDRYDVTFNWQTWVCALNCKYCDTDNFIFIETDTIFCRFHAMCWPWKQLFPLVTNCDTNYFVFIAFRSGQYDAYYCMTQFSSTFILTN